MFLDQFFKKINYVFWNQGSIEQEKSPLQQSIELELSRLKHEETSLAEQIPIHT